jgi:hypothetical protein
MANTATGSVVNEAGGSGPLSGGGSGGLIHCSV